MSIFLEQNKTSHSEGSHLKNYSERARSENEACIKVEVNEASEASEGIDVVEGRRQPCLEDKTYSCIIKS